MEHWRSRRGGGGGGAVLGGLCEFGPLLGWLAVVVCCCRWWSAPVSSCRCVADRGGSPSLCLGFDLQEVSNKV